MRFALISLLAVCAEIASAQTLDGRVIGDSSKKPLASVRVFLVDSTSRKAVESTTTDSGGIFFLHAPRNGTYALAFEQPNKAPSFSGSWKLGRDDARQGIFAVPESDTLRALAEQDVDEKAEPISGTRPPQYPHDLRNRGVQGNVRLRVVIDPAGRLVLSLARVLAETDTAFTVAVKAFLQTARFRPARRLGRPVYQVACIPFTFRITDRFDDKGEGKRLDSLAAPWMSGVCPRE